MNINGGLGLLLLLLLSGRSLFAQSDTSTLSCSGCCCAADPTPAGVMISHIHEKNQWMVSYRYSRTGMEGVYEGNSRLGESKVFNQYLMSPSRMDMDMHMVMAMYGLTDKITLMSMFHYHNMN